MTTVASRVQVEGFEQVARHDLAGSDELLSDLFAVATFHGWELPIEPISVDARDLRIEVAAARAARRRSGRD